MFSHIVFCACKRHSGHVAHGQKDEPTGRRGTEGGEKCEERRKGRWRGETFLEPERYYLEGFQKGKALWDARRANPSKDP